MSYKEENNASNVEYTPTLLTDWNGSADPGKTNDALDQLANRTTVIESSSSLLFGSEFQYAESIATSSRTGSTTYGEKLKMTTPVIIGGNYFVNISYQWAMDDKNRQFLGRVQLDDLSTLYSHSELAHKKNIENSIDNYKLASFFLYITLTPGVHFIDIDYATSDSGKTAFIRNTKIVMWRII